MQQRSATFRRGAWTVSCLVLVLFLTFFWVLALSGCGEGGSTGDDARLARIDGQGYLIEVLGPKRITVGEDARFETRIAPKGDAHLSADYPTLFEVQSSPPFRISSASQRAADAMTHGEDLQVFAVAVRADRTGSAQLEVQIRFGLCEGDLCSPMTETLGFELIVHD